MDDVPVWAHHCDLELDLLGGGFAATGWGDLADLSGLVPDRESFKQAVATALPDKKPSTIAQWAGQLCRFVHQASDGDLVVYRERNGGPINIGRLSGPYYNAAGEVYSQRRPVEWVRTGLVPTAYPSGALYELGASLTWFRIKNHDDVWRAALAGQTPQVEPDVSADEAVEETPLDADKIDQATKDFLVRRLAKHFKGHLFAQLTAHLLDLMGYTTTVSPPGKDYGVDIVAHRGVLGLEPPLIKVQVKSSEGGVGGAPVAELLGRLTPPGEAGLFVTLGYYTSDARKLGNEKKAHLRLIDGNEFVDLLLDHYEQLDDEYTTHFPLRRVYARDLQAETEDARE